MAKRFHIVFMDHQQLVGHKVPLLMKQGVHILPKAKSPCLMPTKSAYTTFHT